MQPRVDLISLGVRSVDASRSFYVDGLGWPVHREVRGEVLFIQANHGLILSLWDAGQMQAEAATDPPTRRPCITLSHNLASTAEVDWVMTEAESAGAEIIAEPKTQPWGGYTGYFADPDGYRWEVAFNPSWAVDGGGKVTL
ncbi:VOC family protein [Arthrobacter sp. UYEF36]|uniref:VOC family protein n=1 Tax=Arthrobacter sp. UYEF36 TaxID=1756366 RepID=UPI00339B2C37